MKSSGWAFMPLAALLAHAAAQEGKGAVSANLAFPPHTSTCAWWCKCAVARRTTRRATQKQNEPK